MNRRPRQISAVLLLLAMLASCASAGPGTATSERSAAEQMERYRRVQKMGQRAVELIREDKLEAAESLLAEALKLQPRHSVNLYNMGCVSARLGKNEQAVDFLEQAALNGFTDFQLMQRDADLVSIRQSPRYQQLLSRKDELQKRAADSMVEFLKRDLGEGYLFEVDPANKMVYATNTDQQTLSALKLSLQAQSAAQRQMLFDHAPDQYVSIVLASPKDFRQIVHQRGVGGFYNQENRILIAQRLGQVMQHEFTHALHNADIEAIGQEHPVWLSEGLGVLFESARFADGQTILSDGFRLRYLQAAAKNNRLIPLEKLLKMPQKAFVANATYAYGESGSVLLYLHEQGLLRRFYEAMKAGYDKDATGRTALEQVSGRPLAQFERDWRAWMLARKAPAMSTGPGGAFLGVRFGDANDGLRIETVQPQSPAGIAGLKSGDVVVGVGDEDVWDQPTLMPMLATFAPGDKITLKIRRGEQYLDIPVVLGKR